MPKKLIHIGASQNLLVVSDVHMQHPTDQRTRYFCDFLDSIESKKNCDVLILLGDIFDFVNARQHFYFELWQNVFSRLKRLKENGVKIIFVEGNHDYGFEHSPCQQIESCFDACGDMIVSTEHSSLGNILLLHSDDVVCPPSYRLFRAIVKSNFFQTLLSPVPGWFTAAFFSRYARISRATDEYRTLEQDFLTQCVSSFVENLLSRSSFNPSFCVFGHIHVNLDDFFQGIRFLSGPAWFSAPNILAFSAAGKVERRWLFDHPPVAKRFVFSTPNQETT